MSLLSTITKSINESHSELQMIERIVNKYKINVLNRAGKSALTTSETKKVYRSGK